MLPHTDPFTPDPGPPWDSLASAAARALREGRFDEAFALADRRCRAALPAASDLLLRAACLTRLGRAGVAGEDVRRALEIEPENLTANRALLDSRHAGERQRAARILLRKERRWKGLAKAVGILAETGVAVAGSIEPRLEEVKGWLVWRGSDPLPLRLVWRRGETLTHINAQATHALSGVLGSAADWRLPWPADTDYLDVVPMLQPVALPDTTLLRPRLHQPETRVRRNRQAATPMRRASRVAIIVPVHSDYEATRVCLASLLADDASATKRKIIAVNDASPDGRITAMLARLAAAKRLHLLHNERNLGFARSVNRALATLSDEDALLLNADTLVPPGFLDRLAAAAYAAGDIATATPLSNNGEYTSFPAPFRVNDLPMIKAIVETDRIAADANAGRVVDLPNGIGFCLYITRRCLDRIGVLSEGFGRGYAEDVEFCLRAASHGMRNVCATDVFVGHAGTRSFVGEKRALVVRNLAEIELRFPGYRAASAAFLEADPLRAARAAIEGVMALKQTPVHVLIAGEATDPHLVRTRARALLAAHDAVWIGTAGIVAGTLRLKLADAAGGLPQSLRFEHSLPDAGNGLIRNLQPLPIATAEFCDCPRVPTVLADALRQLDIPLHRLPRSAHG